jgi:diguanylate cyclase (GGDEF)-like protein/PAS domain S-box-containing protein
MDVAGRIVDLNASAERTFGYPRDQAVGEFLCDLIIPERFREAHRAGLERMQQGEPGRILDRRVEMFAVRANGEEFPVELTVTSADTEPPLFTGFVRDITERRAAEEERERHQRHAAFLNDAGVLLESSLDYEATLSQIAQLAVPRLADWAFVEILQEDGSIERLSMAHSDPAKEALVREYDRRYPINPDAPEGSAKVIRTGRPDLLKEIPDEMLEAVAEDPEHLRILRELGFRSAMVVPLRARGRTLGDIALVSAESGRLYDEDDLAMTQELAIRCALAIDNARLYEEARLNQARLQEQALRDALTGLANRTLFLDRLALALARADRRPGAPALFFFDLDGFKPVNDEFGHHVGDEVLRAVAGRLKPLFRGEDTVCRFGGDEFAVLCEDICAESAALVLADRLVKTLGEPLEFNGRSIKLGVSLGIALSTDVSDTPDGLLRAADAAMYEAKRAGGGRAHLAAALSTR